MNVPPGAPDALKLALLQHSFKAVYADTLPRSLTYSYCIYSDSRAPRANQKAEANSGHTSICDVTQLAPEAPPSGLI